MHNSDPDKLRKIIESIHARRLEVLSRMISDGLSRQARAADLSFINQRNISKKEELANQKNRSVDFRNTNLGNSRKRIEAPQGTAGEVGVPKKGNASFAHNIRKKIAHEYHAQDIAVSKHLEWASCLDDNVRLALQRIVNTKR